MDDKSEQSGRLQSLRIKLAGIFVSLCELFPPNIFCISSISQIKVSSLGLQQTSCTTALYVIRLFFLDVLLRFLKLKKKSLCGIFATAGISSLLGSSVVSGKNDSHHDSEDTSHVGDTEFPLTLSVFLHCQEETT